MFRYAFVAVIVACFVSVLPAADASAEWPCYHGPKRDNKSAETGLLKSWPEGGPKLLWSASGLGAGYSSVSVAGGLIYTAGMVRQQTYVMAFDMDGKRKWWTPNGTSWQSAMPHAVAYAGARGTPTYDDGRVYHLAEQGRLACLDAKTGAEVWTVDLFRQYAAQTAKYGLAESVLIDGDRLICCPAGTKGYMVCLDKKTGKQVWANVDITDPVGYASCVIVEYRDVRQVISVSAKTVFGVDVKTGKLLWRFEHANARENSATDAIFHGGCVFASTGYGKGSTVVRLKPTQGAGGEKETTPRESRGAKSTEADAGGGGAFQTEVVWASNLMDNHHGGVVLLDGFLYGAGHEAKGWFCLDFMTGKQAWQAEGKGSLTYADGMLYMLDEKGTMSLVEASPKQYRVVSSLPVPKGGSGLHWAHPVVCGGRLYIRHADMLFAYDIAARGPQTGSSR
jgi:outer membrane protein assembly factor BamB